MDKKTRKILIISSYPESYAVKRLQAEIELKREALPDVLITSEVISASNLVIFTNEFGRNSIPAKLFIKDEDSVNGLVDIYPDNYFAFIPVDFENQSFGYALVDFLEKRLNLYSPISASGLRLCVDAFANTLACVATLKSPPTILDGRPKDPKYVSNWPMPLPIVIKPQIGYKYGSTIIVDKNNGLVGESVLNSLSELDASFILQSYIETARPQSSDVVGQIKTVVIGRESTGRSLIPAKLYSYPGSSALAEGIGEKVTLSESEKTFILDAAKIVNQDVLVVTHLRYKNDSDDSFLIKVESGLESIEPIESISGENVFQKLIEFTLQNYSLNAERSFRDEIHRLRKFLNAKYRSASSNSEFVCLERSFQTLRELERVVNLKR